MGFLRSILLVAGVALSMCLPYFAGHGLAVHSTKPILLGLLAAVVAAVLFFIYGRSGKDESPAAH